MNVLGIESSCDETAAAIVSERGEVLSDVVLSQVASHAPYGGVVPEIAARDHARAIVPVVEGALTQAGLRLADVDGIAVTCRPGLIGALLVGLQAAKGIAWATGKPLVGVDHLLGHLLTPFLYRSGEDAHAPAFPFLALLVSGGHTALYRCDGPRAEAIGELGATRDDAVGEAFDKVAKLLRLGYPGGPAIDRLAARGDAARSAVVLTPPLPGSRDFSFSGIKSQIARHLQASPPDDEVAVADLCAAFQRAIARTLVGKTVRTARALSLERVVVVGGVAANRELRTVMQRACQERDLELFVPPPARCTDNGAMIAYAGALRLARGERDDASLGPATHTLLERVTRKGRGRRGESR